MYPGLNQSLVPPGYYHRRYPPYYPSLNSLARYHRPPSAQDYHKYKPQSRQKRPRSRPPVLRNSSLPFTTTPAWNIDYATANLIDNIHKPETLNADRCKSAIADCLSNLANDGSMFDAFEQLDHAIFGDRLRDSVFMAWTNEHIGGYASTYLPGAKAPRITVLLDDEVRGMRDPGIRLSMLLHQMVHAYFLLTCTPPSEGAKDVRLDHGNHFLKVCSVLRDLSVQEKDQTIQPDFGAVVMKDTPSKIPWAMALFGHSSHHNRSQRHHHDFHSRFDETIAKESDGTHSVCGAKPTETIEQADLDKWYCSTCEPFLKAKPCQGPTTNTLAKGNKLEETSRSYLTEPIVEFLLDDKPIAIPRSTLARHPKTDKKLKRIVTIPKIVPQDTFFAVTDFLNTSTYSPDLLVFPTRSFHPAPLILPRALDAPAYALQHIRVAKLALTLPVPELADVAIARLHALPELREDVCTAIAEIYDPALAYGKLEKGAQYAPPELLRAWTRHLLDREGDDTGGPGNIGRPSNGDILSRDPAFAKLVRAHGALGADVDVVEQVRAQRTYARQTSALLNMGVLGAALPVVYAGDTAAVERARAEEERKIEDVRRVAEMRQAGILAGLAEETRRAEELRRIERLALGYEWEPVWPAGPAAARNYGSAWNRPERYPFGAA